jgi:hypothetical protein
MGWTVLYIAFGIVALWLLGEVLLQYKARLRWRLLAFAGFLGVVIGVLIPSVVVIGLGAAAFAVGQTYVTLSFRRGFAAGWAVNAPALSSRTRRYDRDRREPSPQNSGSEPAESGYGSAAHTHSDDGLSYGHDSYDRDDVFTPARPTADPTAAEATAVYEPQPLPDDTGSYGIYGDTGYPQGNPQHAGSAQGTDQNYAYGYHTGYDQNHGYDTAGQQQYAAYSDPYIGTPTYGGGPYDPAAYGQQAYGQQGYTPDQYAADFGGETPPGGVWVPQQRSTDDPYGGELPPEQPYPYQGEQPQQPMPDNGYDGQYRY